MATPAPAPVPVPGKRPYHAPVFVAYGSLAALTRGQFFSRPDGDAGRTGNPGRGPDAAPAPGREHAEGRR